MKIDGILERAQLEPRTSDLANTITGAIWFRTDTGVVKLSTGAAYITLTSGAPDGTSLQNSADVWSIVNLGVTTGKINDLAVTTGKINDLAVTTGKINDLGVTTGKLAANAVTTAKMAALNYAAGTSSGAYSTTSGTAVTAASVSFTTTTTRGVMISIQSDGSGNESYIEGTDAVVRLVRSSDNAELARYRVTGRLYSLQHVLSTTSAGAHGINLSVQTNGGSTLYVNYMQVTVHEIG